MPPFAQRLAFEKLRHDVGAVAGGADIVHREDVGMIQSRGGTRLAREALDTIGGVGINPGQYLDRHGAAQPRIPRAIHLSQAADTQQRLYFVGAEPGAVGNAHAATGRRSTAAPS